MTLPDAAYQQLATDLRINRVLTGMWQVSGAHGAIDRRAALASMFAYHDAGFTTWDLADHYGPAEDLIGAFRTQLSERSGPAALASMQAFTKWVPRPGPMSAAVVGEAVDVSRRRMQMDVLDMLQFHWWDYSDERYLDALTQLTAQREAGRIRHLALTNFDSAHLGAIIERGIPIISNQVQYSLIDRRPEVQMVGVCQAHNLHLLTYGTLCGGFLSERYLHRPEPRPNALDTASLRKYKQMIDAWGGWDLLQDLLVTLKRIAERHGVSIANVAARAVLDRPAVAGIILGARLGLTEHIADNARIFALRLTAEDTAEIETVLARGRNLYDALGDCGDEYRH